jgi:capsular exopolysaccharide synthesis family protein
MITNITATSNTVLKEFLKKALAFKFVYIGCIVLFLAIAYFVNKYSATVYQVQAKILINKNNSERIDNAEIFGRASQYESTKGIDNEVNMLTSYSLVSKTIDALNLEVGYFFEKSGLITQSTEVYKGTPFIVVYDKSHSQPIDVKFYIEFLTDSTFRIYGSAKSATLFNYLDDKDAGRIDNFKFDLTAKFNQQIVTDFIKLTISLKDKNIQDIKNRKGRYYFQFFYTGYLTNSYLYNLKVEPLSQLASIIFVSFKGQNANRINDFLNKYLEIYLEASLERKNKIAKSTIDFIDSQISDISDSLSQTESKLRDYKSANQVVDMSFQGQRIYDQISQIEIQKANLLAQKRYYSYIIEYFNKNSDVANVVPPSAANVVDPIMNQLILDMISLNKERSDIISDSKKGLFLSQVENKIKQQKETILENVHNNLNTLNVSISELNYRYQKLSEEIAKLPKTELRLTGINRQYKLNDAIYTYLLQRKAESQISKASNLPESEILEPSRLTSTSIIYPKRTLNYIIALFLAFLIPSGFILGRDLINDKITGIYELEHLTKKPVIGMIYRNRYKIDDVVVEKPRSYIAESFRTLRTNLFIKLKNESSKVILVTSSIPREGKSFTALNLASAISMLGHKTVIVDCDLRRPSLHSKLKTENNIGLSNYLVGKAVIEDIILELSPSLDFITSGPILPNPAELLESGACDKFFYNLKQKYDFVIIDTPPLGALSDSYLLMKHASQILLLSRFNYTKKDIIYQVVRQLEDNNISNYNLVFNDVDFNKTEFGGYYNAYYSEDKKS